MNSTFPDEARSLAQTIGSPGSETSVSDNVYHYTSAAGANPILESKLIRVSNARFLNDSSELRLAYELALEIVDRRRSTRRLEKALLENDLTSQDHAENYLLLLMKQSMESIYSNTNLDAYIACFALNDDVLSQWRGYASGGGFSIGVNSQCLMESAFKVAAAIGSSEGRVAFRLVQYEHSEWKSNVTELVDMLVESIRRRVAATKGLDVERVSERYCSGFTQAISRAAPFIKDSGFAEEQEARLSIYTNSGVHAHKFRTSGPSIIPYFEIPLGDALSSVRVGPREDHELQLRALSLMNLGSAVTLVHSAIPFRT